MSLMEKFADPNMFTHLSVGEKITAALVTTLMGMGVTFIVLTLIMVIIWIMGKALDRAGKSTAVAGDIQNINVGAGILSAPAIVGSNPNEEIVAVIMAAISEISDIPMDKFVVKRISRVGSGFPSWRSTGTNECLDTRKM